MTPGIAGAPPRLSLRRTRESTPPASPKWKDPVTGSHAWLDGTLGWETVRTDAADPHEHACVVARFLAAELGVQGAPIVADQGSNHLRVAAALADLGADVTSRETWTADGLHVGGVQAGSRFFVVA